MANISFKKGLLAALPQSFVEGTFYVTTDEHAMYLDVDGSHRIRLGDFQEFANLDALKQNVNPSESALYYIKDINCMAKWNGAEYIQINTDTGATSVEVVGEGNAVTAASYDASKRKLTLTMGTTFAVPQDIADVVGVVPDKAGEGGKQTVVEYVDAKTAGIASDEALKAMGEKVSALETKVGDQTVAEQAAAAAKAIQGETESTVKAVEDAFNNYKTTNDEAVAAKVASVGAGDASVAVGGEATAPTVAVVLSKDEDNDLKLASDGLKVAVADYSIEKLEAATEGAAASYQLTKDGVKLGAVIDIPKDMVVKSGSVKTFSEEDKPAGVPSAGTYIELVLANKKEDKLYINVTSLIEYVTSGSTEKDMVVIAVSEDHKVTATITDGTITRAKIDAGFEAQIAALEADKHAHKNLELLETYTQTEVNLADAVAKKHEHANAEELNKIEIGDKDKWDAAEQNAKDHADNLNTAMDERVTAAEGSVTTLTGGEEVSGSVANAIKVAKEYSDSQSSWGSF